MLQVRKVVVAISGGVDSAVAAWLLKQRGYELEGLFMQNWDIRDEKGFCSADEDYKDATLVCHKLNIKLNHINFVKEYWNEVFCDLLKEYEVGNTPNPDVLCNRHIKFNYFYKYAINELGADAIATGHYAKSSFGPFLEHYDRDKGARLYRASDIRKDQTFFLCQIPQEPLQRTMFPLGHYTKTYVKQLAMKQGLEKIAKKKESTGICFIGNRKFQDFIQEYIQDKPGDFIDADTGQVVARHSGVHQLTVGQRARLQGLHHAYYIARKDLETNRIYIVKNTKHPLLYTNLIFTSQPYWIHSQPEELKNGNILDCEFKFQHTKMWVNCQVCQTCKGLIIKVNRYKRAITPGQYAVLSKNGECLGSAKISNSGLSHFSVYYSQNNKLSEKSSFIEKFVNQECSDLSDNEDYRESANI